MRRRSLPQLVIPVPCRVDWNGMTPIDADGRARFCDSCERPVYDSASMTRGDLQDLIATHEGRRLPCVRLHRRPDGTIVTRDCLASFFKAGRFLWLKVGLAAMAFWTWAFGLRPLSQHIQRSLAAQRRVEPALADQGQRRMMGMVVLRPGPAAERARPSELLSRGPRSQSRSFFYPVDDAPPLRTLEADEDLLRAAVRDPRD
jgi:hypothetical protein